MPQRMGGAATEGGCAAGARGWASGAGSGVGGGSMMASYGRTPGGAPAVPEVSSGTVGMKLEESSMPGLPQDEDLLRAYVGPGADYYLERWRGLRNGASRTAGFNKWAFFLAWPWLFSRKIYVAGFAILVISLVELCIDEFVLPLGKAYS